MSSSPSVLAAIATALIVPGDRPDRFEKARQRCGHAMIIDLEDAVAPEDKPTARGHVADYLQAAPHRPPLLGVRVNALTESAALDDLLLLRGLVGHFDFVALPKAESGRDITVVRAALATPDMPVMAIVETVAGLARAPDIAVALVGHGALGFGGADYCAETGMAMAEMPMLMARTRLVEAAATGGVPAVDVPYLAIGDDEGLRADAAAARDLGFSGKLAIHPGQTAPIIEAFEPSAAALAEADRIIAAFHAADGKAIKVDGRMVDKPVYQRAVALRARAKR